MISSSITRTYRSTPVSRGCLYFFDINRPPPHAAYNEPRGKNTKKSVSRIRSKPIHLHTVLNTHVDMHPQFVSLANVRNLVQRIECTQYRRSGRCRHEKRNLTACLALNDLSLQFAGNHAAMLIGRNHDAIIGAETANRSARLHRIMTLIAGEHDQFTGQTFRTVLLVVGEHAMSGRQEGVQIRNGAAGCQNRIATVPADNFAHLRQNDGLHQNENGRNFIRKHVCVGCGRQPFAGHRNNVQTARQLIEEVRMTCRKNTHKNAPREIGMRLTKIDDWLYVHSLLQVSFHFIFKNVLKT